jgi:hypothetical protein
MSQIDDEYLNDPEAYPPRWFKLFLAGAAIVYIILFISIGLYQYYSRNPS